MAFTNILHFHCCHSMKISPSGLLECQMGIFQSMMMSGMPSAIFMNGLVVCAIPLADGFFAVIFLVVGTVDPGVMFFPVSVSSLVVCAILFATGFPAMVFFMVGAVYSCAAVPVMASLMMAVGISGAAGGRDQQTGSEQ